MGLPLAHGLARFSSCDAATHTHRLVLRHICSIWVGLNAAKMNLTTDLSDTQLHSIVCNVYVWTWYLANDGPFLFERSL